MFKKVFFLAVFSSVLATLVSLLYSNIYYSMIVDFSEAFGIMKLFLNCLIPALIGCIVYYGIHLIIKVTFLADFIFNVMISMTSLVAVFLFLKSNDPEFINEDAQIMIDYYKGFVMPMLFFPALSWFTLKPLFLKPIIKEIK